MNTNCLEQYNKVSTYQKIKLGISLYSHLKDSNIVNYPALYIGSNTDIEFPIILGARKIILLDPCFKDENKVNAVFQKIIQYDISENAAIKKISNKHHHIKYQFDFGEGIEDCYIDILSLGYDEYQPFIPLGYIIEFNSNLDHTLCKPELLTKLINNGLIINNVESPLRHQTLTFMDFILFNKDLNSIEENKAKNMGLATLRFENIPFSVYQKKQNNPKLIDFARTNCIK